MAAPHSDNAYSLREVRPKGSAASGSTRRYNYGSRRPKILPHAQKRAHASTTRTVMRTDHFRLVHLTAYTCALITRSAVKEEHSIERYPHAYSPLWGTRPCEANSAVTARCKKHRPRLFFRIFATFLRHLCYVFALSLLEYREFVNKRS